MKCKIDFSNHNDMLRPSKENKWRHNRESAPKHEHRPKLIESNLQAAAFGAAASHYSKQLSGHIVIRGVSDHCQNYDQNRAFSKRIGGIEEESRDFEITAIKSATLPSLTLIPILDIVYIESSEVHDSKRLNLSNGRESSGMNDDDSSTDCIKPKFELREFFKFNKLGMQIEQLTKSSALKPYIESKSSKSLFREWNIKREQFEINSCKDNTSKILVEIERQKQVARYKARCGLTSIKEVEESSKHSPEPLKTSFEDNNFKQIKVKRHHTGVGACDSVRKLAVVIAGRADRESNSINLQPPESSEMKRRHRAQEHDQKQQQQEDQVETRCCCRRQQVAAICASASASASGSASASNSTSISTSASASTSTQASSLAAKAVSTVTANAVVETTTTSKTKTGFQFEARLKALRLNKPPERQVAVIERAKLEAADPIADKQRQQVFCCMPFSSQLSSCSSSSRAPFSSLSQQLAPVFKHCPHCERSLNEEASNSSLFIRLGNLNKNIRKKRGYYEERAKSKPRLNKQQRNTSISTNNKVVDEVTRGQPLIKLTQTSRKSFRSSQYQQQNSLQTTLVQDPSSSILCYNKASSTLSYDKVSTLGTAQVSQNSHLLRRQSKIEQQQRETCFKEKFAIQVSRQVKRPKRRERSVHVEIRKHIRRQEIAKRRQRGASIVPQETTSKATNKLVTPNLSHITTNNNGVILVDSFNNNNNSSSPKGLTTSCSLYKNTFTKSRVENLIMRNRSSPSPSSNSSSSSSASSTSSPLSANHQYNSSSANAMIISNKQDKRPLLGEGGILTDRLMVCDRPSLIPIENHTIFSSRTNPSACNSNTKPQDQRIKLKTITEVNVNSSSASSSSHHNQNQRDHLMTIGTANNVNNLHPLEVLDQQARMSISIYDPLPKPRASCIDKSGTVIQSRNFFSSTSSHCTSSNSPLDTGKYPIQALGMQSSRQLDKRKDSMLTYSDRLKSKTARQPQVDYPSKIIFGQRVNVTESGSVIHQCDEDEQHVTVVGDDDEDEDEEEERLRESFPLELRKPIIDLPTPMGRLETEQQRRQQLEFPNSISPTTESNILFVTIELGANQTRPLRINPSWSFEELVENLHQELLELQRESSTVIPATRKKKKKIAKALYGDARELAKLFESRLVSASSPSLLTRKDAEGFVSSVDGRNQQHYRDNADLPIDPTAMNSSDRARMVGQVGGKRSCLENEAPCWIRNENRGFKQHVNMAECDMSQNCQQKPAAVDCNQSRLLRVLNRPIDERIRRGKLESYECSYKRSRAAPEPLDSNFYPQLPLPLSHASKSPFSDWRYDLRHTRNRKIINDDRHLASFANVSSSIKCNSKALHEARDEHEVEPETGAEEEAEEEQDDYLQCKSSISSSGSNMSQCQQRKCSCNTSSTSIRANKTSLTQAHGSRESAAHVNLKKMPDLAVPPKTMENANEDKRATTTCQSVTSNSFSDTNINKSGLIDSAPSTGKLGSADSHIVCHNDNSQVNKSISNNHSTPDELVAMMNPAWQNKNRTTEAANSNQKHTDTIRISETSDTDKQREENEDEDEDEKQARGADIEKENSFQQLTSQTLSYARTASANKGEFICPKCLLSL